MRRVLSVCLLASVGVLVVSGRAEGGWMSRAAYLPSSESCPDTPPTSAWRVRVGHAAARNGADGIEAARAEAKRSLEAALCAGIEGSPRCLSAALQITPFGAGAWDRQARSACASVAVPTEVLAGKDTDFDALDDGLAQIVGEVAEATIEAPLRVLAPVWAESGCPAGDLGAYLTTALQGQLRGLTLADAPDGAAAIRLELAAAGEQLVVSGVLRAPGAQGWTSLGALRIPADLFPVEAHQGASCHTVEGGEALAVQLENLEADWMICAGERVSPGLGLSRPARLRLYSVEGDGEGYLVWPWQAADDRVYGPGDLPELPPFVAMQTTDHSDSRLVAVAYPPDVAPPLAPGLCALQQPLSLNALPEAAAVSTFAFHVAPAGERLCRGRGDTHKAAQARAAAALHLSATPLCR